MADVRFTSTLPDFGLAMEGTKWSERGWTYQEDALSPRRLFFLNSEVWFECQEMMYREDPYSAGHNPQVLRNGCLTSRESTRLRKDSSIPPGDFHRHLSAYAERSLTYKSDIYYAFSGIINALFPRSPASYGLPHLAFHEAILWGVKEGRLVPRIRERDRDDDSTILPSWSWVSVFGSVEDHSSSLVAPLVDWFETGTSVGISPIIAAKTPRGWERGVLTDCFPLFLALAWSNGCFDAPSRNILPENFDFKHDKTKEELWARWPNVESFWRECHQDRGSKDSLLLWDCASPGVIICRAQTAFFKLKPHPEHKFCIQQGLLLDIVNENGMEIGQVGSSEFQLKSGRKMEGPDLERKFEFVAVSTSTYAQWLACDRLWHGPTRSSLEWFGNWIVEVPVVNVFLIGWREDVPTARRMSIGWIYLKA
ncbi:het-domain-containing protein [Diplodia corticola]|uniref:Het-domain-containing protein n=1 Tax=Diplodia corticola TaxID=236234 RepID=A0A1J9R5L6_9PEZI|nr:het-domain-containing protein [Diplodia corticola]OJD35904.1 het-domain-containing protein [Diplodia corticola]